MQDNFFGEKVAAAILVAVMYSKVGIAPSEDTLLATYHSLLFKLAEQGKR